MGIKRGEVFGFYKHSTTAVAITWMQQGITNKKQLGDKMGMKAYFLRNWFRPHIQSGVIIETDTDWMLSDAGREKYQRYQQRKGVPS
jgi:hypothetical protein